jgi:hypothetical protein
MYIDEFRTPAFSCSGVPIETVMRKGSVLLCGTDGVEVERILIEFEDEDTTRAFEASLEEGASIIIDDDISLEMAPASLQKRYWHYLETGDEKRLNQLITLLWERYGIDPNPDRLRETSGIIRIAVMHDDGVSAYGFHGMEDALREWMNAHGFPVTDSNLNLS